MSKKHVEDYFNQICDDYHEMVETLKDMEEECNNGLVAPERVEQLKKVLEPIKINYMRISYIMYLLHMPTRKQKQKRYEKQNSPFKFRSCDTLKSVREENKQSIENAKNYL